MNTNTLAEFSRLSGLIDSIHACPNEPEKWGQCIQSIAGWMGATKAVMFTPQHPQHQGGFDCSHDISCEHIAQWHTLYRAYLAPQQIVHSLTGVVYGADFPCGKHGGTGEAFLMFSDHQTANIRFPNHH